MGRSQIGGDHALVAPDLGRRSIGDDRAMIEHRDPIGNGQNEIHVVLDQQHGHPHALELADDHRERADLLGDQAGGGLVEQQYTRSTASARAISSSRRWP